LLHGIFFIIHSKINELHKKITFLQKSTAMFKVWKKISHFPHFPKHRNPITFPHFPQNFPQNKAGFSTLLGWTSFFRSGCLKPEKTVHTVSKSSFWEEMSW